MEQRPTWRKAVSVLHRLECCRCRRSGFFGWALDVDDTGRCMCASSTDRVALSSSFGYSQSGFWRTRKQKHSSAYHLLSVELQWWSFISGFFRFIKQKTYVKQTSVVVFLLCWWNPWFHLPANTLLNLSHGCGLRSRNKSLAECVVTCRASEASSSDVTEG